MSDRRGCKLRVSTLFLSNVSILLRILFCQAWRKCRFLILRAFLALFTVSFYFISKVLDHGVILSRILSFIRPVHIFPSLTFLCLINF